MLSPYVILGITIGALFLLVMFILGIAWRRCGCPICFNEKKKHARQPRLKVVPPKNHSVPAPGNLGHPGASKSRHPGAGAANAAFEGTAWREKGASSSQGRRKESDVEVGIEDEPGTDGVDSGFSDITTVNKSTDEQQKHVRFSGSEYSHNPETGEVIFTPPTPPLPPNSRDMINDLGSLVAERALLQFRQLTSNQGDDGDPSSAHHLQDLRQEERSQSGAVLKAMVTEKIYEVEDLMVSSRNNYDTFMDKLSTVNPPNPEVLLAKEQFVSEILQCILTYITDCFPRFTGHVEGFGSYFGGHFGSASPDYDYQYIMQAFDLNDPDQVQVQERSDGSYDLTIGSPELYEEWKDCIVDGNQLDSQKVLQKFHEVLFHTIQHILLPSEGTHGGVLTPCFSGLRGYDKALCIQYVWRGEILKIDLVPSLHAPKDLSSKILQKLHPELQATLLRTMPDPTAELETLITITAGIDWSLSGGLLNRQILQMFDLNPALSKAKTALGSIREHLFRLPAPDLEACYASVTTKLSEAMRYTHKVEIVEMLNRLADRKYWDLFVLVVMATANSHPELKDNVCDTTLRNPQFHKALPSSLPRFCHDSLRSVIYVKAVLLMDLLIELYLSNLEEFHSPNPGITEFQVVQEVLQRFGHAVERSSAINMPFFGRSNDAILQKYDESIPPEDLDTAYIDLVRAMCKVVCEKCNQ